MDPSRGSRTLPLPLTHGEQAGVAMATSAEYVLLKQTGSLRTVKHFDAAIDQVCFQRGG